MKPTALKTLIYLFENLYQEKKIETDQPEWLRLNNKSREIAKALGWLNLLVEHRMNIPPSAFISKQNSRIYQDYEYQKLGSDGISLLMFLECIGILDLETREAIINLAMSAQVELLSLEHLKWLILIKLNDKIKQDEQAQHFLQKLVLLKQKLKESMH